MISCENVCPSYFYHRVLWSSHWWISAYRSGNSSRAETLRGPSDSYISCSPRQTNVLQWWLDPARELQAITNPVNYFPTFRMLTSRWRPFLGLFRPLSSDDVTRLPTPNPILCVQLQPCQSESTCVLVHHCQLQFPVKIVGVVDHPANHCENVVGRIGYTFDLVPRTIVKNVVRSKDRVYFWPPFKFLDVKLSWGACLNLSNALHHFLKGLLVHIPLSILTTAFHVESWMLSYCTLV